MNRLKCLCLASESVYTIRTNRRWCAVYVFVYGMCLLIACYILLYSIAYTVAYIRHTKYEWCGMKKKWEKTETEDVSPKLWMKSIQRHVKQFVQDVQYIYMYCLSYNGRPYVNSWCNFVYLSHSGSVYLFLLFASFALFVSLDYSCDLSLST